MRFEETRYVWNPAKPTTDQTEKKHITATIAVKKMVKEDTKWI